MNKIRLLIVGDNRVQREGIKALIERESSVRVVGAFGDQEAVIPKIRELKPSVVLLDLGLKCQNSLSVVRSVRENFPDIGVIIMDLVPTQTEVLEFVQAGVSGFILKDASVEDFLSAIHQVSEGVKVLPTHLTGPLFTQIAQRNGNGSQRNGWRETVRMTRREEQVIELIAEGETNKGIAGKLHVSTFTVKSHVHNILEKLGLHTRVQIAKYVHAGGGNSHRTEETAEPSEGVDLRV